MNNFTETTNESKPAVDLIALSAKYRHDRVDKGKVTPKFNYNPVRYDYEEGYSLFHHDPLSGVKDEAFSNRNYFFLLNNVAMSDIAENRVVDPLDLTVWLTIKAPNGKYIGTTKDPDGVVRIYADTDWIELDSRNVFRMTRSNRQGMDGPRYVIAQNELYMTVDPRGNMYDIMMKDYLGFDADNKQHFIVERGNRPDIILFCTDIPYHWKHWPKFEGSEFDVPPNLEPKNIHRYFSLYDQFIPKGKFYNNDGKTRRKCSDGGYPEDYTGYAPNMVKAIGNTYWSRYTSFTTTRDGVAYKDLHRISNNYIFRVLPDEVDIRDDSLVVGYDGKVRWVKYYEEIYDTIFNPTVDPKKVFDGIKPSLLFEHSYENAVGKINEDTDIEISSGDKRLKVMREDDAPLNNSPIELKTVMPSDYKYATLDKDIPLAEAVADGVRGEIVRVEYLENTYRVGQRAIIPNPITKNGCVIKIGFEYLPFSASNRVAQGTVFCTANARHRLYRRDSGVLGFSVNGKRNSRDYLIGCYNFTPNWPAISTSSTKTGKCDVTISYNGETSTGVNVELKTEGGRTLTCSPDASVNPSRDLDGICLGSTLSLGFIDYYVDEHQDPHNTKLSEFSLNGRIYYFQAYVNGELKVDIVPVRVGETGYFYDNIAKKLYKNVGDGEFIIGPDIKA